LTRLLSFERGISLASKIGGGTAGLAEEAGEDRLNERSKDDLGSVGDWESHPEDQDELEHIVEGEPVDSIDHALDDCEEGIDNPVCQPLSIIHLACAEQCVQRIVSGDDEAGKVDQELASDVEEDQEAVDTGKAEEDIDFGNVRLLLEVIEDGVSGELFVNGTNVVLSFILERHCGRSRKCLHRGASRWEMRDERQRLDKSLC